MTNEQTIDEIMALASEVEDQGLIHACGEGAEPIAERDALRNAIAAALAAKDAEIERLTAQLAEPAKPEPGEWIEWAGGECPIEDGVGFQFRFRDDSQAGDCIHHNAPTWVWSARSYDGDIVAYRVLP